jgi:hypothetical protein
MFDQIAIGTTVTFISIVFGAVMWWMLIRLLHRFEAWIRRPPHAFKTIFVIVLVVVWTMLITTFGVWLWAIVFSGLLIFSSMEEAVYYSLVAYTTLGLGDVVVPKDWRLLGGMTGANGFLMFGVLTAMLTDTLRDMRRMRWTED